MRVRAVQQERGREVRLVKSFVIRRRQVMMMMVMKRVRARTGTPNLCTPYRIGVMVTDQGGGGSTDGDSASICGPRSITHKTRPGVTKGHAASFRSRATHPRKKGGSLSCLLYCHFGARWRA